jgi:hypothetical protein
VQSKGVQWSTDYRNRKGSAVRHKDEQVNTGGMFIKEFDLINCFYLETQESR